MHSGSGSPFDICKKHEGNEGILATCRELVQSCVDQQSQQENQGAEEGAASAFELKECNGKTFSPSVKPTSFDLCVKIAERMASDSRWCPAAKPDEAKKPAAKASGPIVPIYVGTKDLPTDVPDGALLLVGNLKDGLTRFWLRRLPSDPTYVIDASDPDAIMPVMKWLGVSVKEALAIMRGDAAFYLREKGGFLPVSAKELKEIAAAGTTKPKPVEQKQKPAEVVPEKKVEPEPEPQVTKVESQDDDPKLAAAREELDRMRAEQAKQEERKRLAEEKKQEAKEKKQRDAEEKKRLAEEKKRLAEEKRQREIEEKKRREEEAVARAKAAKQAKVDARHEAEATIWRKAKEVREKIADRILTPGNVESRWRREMKIIFTTALDDDFLLTLKDNRSAFVVDLSDPAGCALAKKLTIPIPAPGVRYEIWSFEGGLKGGVPQGDVTLSTGFDERAEVLLARHAYRADPSGFVFVGDDLAFEEHFVNETSEAIVVVGDPMSDEAQELAATIADEKRVLGEKWRLVWIPHKSNPKPFLEKLGIDKKRVPVDGSVRMWWVSYSSNMWDAKPHEPAGFLEIGNREMADRYLWSDDKRTLLLVGTPGGPGSAETQQMRRDILMGQAEEKTAGLDVSGKAVERLVYADQDVLLGLYADSQGMSTLIGRATMVPRAYVFEGKGKKRTGDDVPIESLPTSVVPVDTKPQPKTPAKEGLFGVDPDATSIAIKVREKKVDISDSMARDGVHAIDITNLESVKILAKLDLEGKPLVIVWGDGKSSQVGENLVRLGRALFNRHETAETRFLDTGKGDPHDALDLFRINGKRPGSSGIAKCERSRPGVVWSCQPYQFPGPQGFIESSPDVIDGIIEEIKAGAYPVMVVVGQVRKDVGDDHCAHCVALKKQLEEAQAEGKRPYERLVFVNLNRSSAWDHLRRMGIEDQVKQANFVPQAYVFKGGELVSTEKGMEAWMKQLRKELGSSSK